MTTAKIYYNTQNHMYYRVQPNGVVDCSTHRNMTKSIRSGYTAGEVRENRDGQFERVTTNQHKNAWKSETVTVEVPKQNALVGHIEELQRIITRRNKQIEQLTEAAKLQDETITAMATTIDDLGEKIGELEQQLNAEADEETEPKLAEQGLYKLKRQKDPMRWLKTIDGNWYVVPEGTLIAGGDRAAAWEAQNLSVLERTSE